MHDAMLDPASFANPGQTGFVTQGQNGFTTQGQSGEFDSDVRHEIARQRILLAYTDAMLRARTDAMLSARSVPAPLAQADRLVLLGTLGSLNAAGVARGWIEQLARLPCDVEPAVDWCHRAGPLSPGSVGVLISRSGESAETLAALALLQSAGLPTIAVTGAHHSTLASSASLLWPTAPNEEKAGTATGSFTTALMALLHLGLAIGVARGHVDQASSAKVERQLAEASIAGALAEAAEPRCAAIARRLANAGEIRFGGRQWCACMAAQGAQNLRDLCPIPAEAQTGGALRYGPMEPGLPVVMCAAADAEVAGAVADATQVRGRGGHVIVLSDACSPAAFHDAAHETLALPGRGIAYAFAQAVALQLIAHHTARAFREDARRFW
jgi:glucosamine--fructose-6-phosphate aminotransferase (isomerizing)